MKVLARVKTRFNNIMVVQNGTYRDMWFVRDDDFFLQSRINIKDPQELVLVYSEMTLASLLFQAEPKRVLIVGLGGSVVSNRLHEWFPDALINVVEIDGMIVEIAKKFFFLRESNHYKVHKGDGRVFIQNERGKEKYDFIVLDAFKSGSVPYHLKTAEFYNEIRSILAPGGVVSSNLYGKSNQLKPRDNVTFSSIFKQTYLFDDPEGVATVLHATDHEQRWTKADMARAAAKITASKRVPLDMRRIVEMYQPGKYEKAPASTFLDNFPGQEFLRVVENNNENTSAEERPYPIKSSS